MKLYLDTSTPTTILKLDNQEYSWHSDRDLAEKLLDYIHNKLIEHGKDFKDITEITFMSGPGSFTGLRISSPWNCGNFVRIWQSPVPFIVTTIRQGEITPCRLIPIWHPGTTSTAAFWPSRITWSMQP